MPWVCAVVWFWPAPFQRFLSHSMLLSPRVKRIGLPTEADAAVAGQAELPLAPMREG